MTTGTLAPPGGDDAIVLGTTILVMQASRQGVGVGVSCLQSGRFARETAAFRGDSVRHRDLHDEDGLLSDECVAEMLSSLLPVQKLFLAGLGRGLSPESAALRAGWPEHEAGRIAELYLSSHPSVAPLAQHVLRLRELADMDGEWASAPGTGRVQ